MSTIRLRDHLVPLSTLLGVFALTCYFFSDFRFSDPDQYYHFTVAREWSTTWNFWKFPQVVGMGWDQYFVDKEFLFHVVSAIAYKFAGDAGVIFITRLFGFMCLSLVYFIAWRATKDVTLGLFAALFPFFSDTFILHLMQIRAYHMGLVFVLGIIWFLIERKRIGLMVCAFLFYWSYHAIQIPLCILLVWSFSEWLQGKSSRFALWGILAVVASTIIHPYFPSNLSMTWTTLQIAFDQFQTTTLVFGPEQEPYRSDHFAMVFRFNILLFLLGGFVFWLRYKGSRWLQIVSKENENVFLFFSLLTTVLLLLLLLTPRMQEYFIPSVSIYGALAIASFVQKKRVLIATTSVAILISALLWPYKTFSETIIKFKQFDESYFSVVKSIDKPGKIFNCEWWGGHYPIYTNANIPVLDVLDPTLLRSFDDLLFETVTQVRAGKSLDPYFVMKHLLSYDYTLCSSTTPLFKQLEKDPRFEEMARSHNLQEDVAMFRLRAPEEVTTLNAINIRKGNDEWTPRLAISDVPTPAYYSENVALSCVEIRATAEDVNKMASADFVFISGTGLVSITKDQQPILAATALPEEMFWGELLIPNDKSGDWTFKICPHTGGRPIALAVFLLNTSQKNIWCQEKTTGAPSSYKMPQGRCHSITAYK